MCRFCQGGLMTRSVWRSWIPKTAEQFSETRLERCSCELFKPVVDQGLSCKCFRMSRPINESQICCKKCSMSCAGPPSVVTQTFVPPVDFGLLDYEFWF